MSNDPERRPDGAPGQRGAADTVHESDVHIDDHLDAVVSEQDLTVDDRALTPEISQRKVLATLVSEEVVRAGIALLLFALLTYVIVQAFAKVENWEQAKELLDVVLPTVTALLGSAVGFYFGTRVSK